MVFEVIVREAYKCDNSDTENVRNVYKILVGKPEGKILLGSLRRRWE